MNCSNHSACCDGSLVLLSGGMDSATVLAKAIEESKDVGCVEALIFTYGSKHNAYENDMAKRLCSHYRITYHHVDFTNIARDSLKSNLLKTGGDIPEGHYAAENMSQTVVPGRNLIFLSIAMGIAWSQGLHRLWIGAHSGDHTIYPDCRPEFIEAVGNAIYLGSDRNVALRTPFLHGNKTTILEEGFKLGVPYHLTRTCYKDQEVACGKCGACQERLEAFAAHGVEDPIEYESRIILPKQ